VRQEFRQEEDWGFQPPQKGGVVSRRAGGDFCLQAKEKPQTFRQALPLPGSTTIWAKAWRYSVLLATVLLHMSMMSVFAGTRLSPF